MYADYTVDPGPPFPHPSSDESPAFAPQDRRHNLIAIGKRRHRSPLPDGLLRQPPSNVPRCAYVNATNGYSPIGIA